MNVVHVMLKPGFNADVKKVFHEHLGQISIVNVLQAKPTDWNTYYIENTTREHKEQNNNSASLSLLGA